MRKKEVIIENADVVQYFIDKFSSKYQGLAEIEKKNDYVEGQMAALRSIIFVLEQMVSDSWTKENVINNFYRLQLEDTRFEEKYREIWEE